MKHDDDLNPLTEANRPIFDGNRSRRRKITSYIERLMRCGINCDTPTENCRELCEFFDLVEGELMPPREA